jgi:hypothetical protein
MAAIDCCVRLRCGVVSRYGEHSDLPKHVHYLWFLSMIGMSIVRTLAVEVPVMAASGRGP